MSLLLHLPYLLHDGGAEFSSAASLSVHFAVCVLSSGLNSQIMSLQTVSLVSGS